MDAIKNEPVMTAAMVTVLTWLGTRFGCNLDAQTAGAITLIVLTIASWFARRFSTPVSKAEKVIDRAYIAQPGDPKPTL